MKSQDTVKTVRSEFDELKSKISSLKEIIKVLSEEKEVASSARETQCEREWTVSREKN